MKNRSNNRFSLAVPLLDTFEEFVQGELIQAALANVFQIQGISLNAIDRILELLHSNTGAICEINKKYFALRDRNHIIFAKKQKSFNINMSIDRIGSYTVGNYKLILSEVTKNHAGFSSNSNVEFFDMDLVPLRIQLRSWELGDVFQPIGMTGTVKVSDFLTNHKVSLLDKQDVLLLATKSDIIWVCGKRLSNKFKVTSDTKKIIRAELITNENQSHENKEKIPDRK